MLEEIKNLTDYLKSYSNTLAEKIQKQAVPVFNPGDPWDHKISKLLRTPYQAQGDVIMSLTQILKERNSALIVGEMGSGKTLLGLSVPYIYQNGGRPTRTIIMCPGHLVKKWQREAINTVPGAKAAIIKSISDLKSLNLHKKPETPEYVILGKDRAKLSYIWRPAVTSKRIQDGYFCPDCGSSILDKDGVPVSFEYLKKNKKYCEKCHSALWQSDNKRIRRYSIAEYIKKYLKNSFDFFIADEVHQLKGGNTAQGNCFGGLSSVSKKTIAFTGTLLGGYADDIFYILFRLSPESLKKEGIEYKSLSSWISKYGVLEKITRHYPEDNVSSKGKRSQTVPKRKPGISPAVFSRHLLDKSVFIHLEDIALNLPPISEEVVQIRMDEMLSRAYLKLEFELKSAVREALARGSKSLLSVYLNTLLSYPDRPFDNEPIADPQTQSIISVPQELSKENVYPKEKQLIKLVQNEIKNDRKVFIFCQYTQTKDITYRLKEILVKNKIKTEILKSTVEPELREEWINEKVKQGYEAIICNPKLVETGLDLYDFPTLIFYQTGYSIFTLRQASRRSWRIGQKKPVKVFYLFYQNTMQEKALQLMGNKLEASLAIEGKFSDEGLLAMTSGEDLTTAMAKALVEGLENVEGAEQIWRKLNDKQRTLFQEKEEIVEDKINESIPSSETITEKDNEKVVYVDFISFMGKRKKVIERKEVKASELDSVQKENQTAQLSLF